MIPMPQESSGDGGKKINISHLLSSTRPLRHRSHQKKVSKVLQSHDTRDVRLLTQLQEPGCWFYFQMALIFYFLSHTRRRKETAKPSSSHTLLPLIAREQQLAGNGALSIILSS